MILACILGQLRPELEQLNSEINIIDYVRMIYCHQAIESTIQEDFVLEFFGLPIPVRSATKVSWADIGKRIREEAKTAYAGAYTAPLASIEAIDVSSDRDDGSYNIPDDAACETCGGEGTAFSILNNHYTICPDCDGFGLRMSKA